MKTSPNDWVEWDEKEVLPFTGGISFHIRTLEPVVVTNEFGLILGFGNGQQEIAVTGEGEIHFQCESPIWVRPSSRVQERLKQSTEIFTSLDRPPAMSPEMQAIARMMRRNEIDRELDRQEMEKRFADRSRDEPRPKPSSDAPEASADEETTLVEDPERGRKPSSKQSKPKKGGDAEPVGVPDGNASSDESSPADS